MKANDESESSSTKKSSDSNSLNIEEGDVFEGGIDSQGITYHINTVSGGIVAHTVIQQIISPVSLRAPHELITLLQKPTRRMKNLEFYVPLDGSSTPFSVKQNEQRQSLHDIHVLPFLLDKSRSFLLLVGDSGAGKSTYVQKLVEVCWDDFATQKIINRIPILLECNRLLDKNLTKRSLIQDIMTSCGLTEAEVTSLKELPLLFIFDGYDEKQIKDTNIFELFNLNEWNAKILTTCRIQYIQENRQYKILFPESINTTSLEIHIYPFSPSQVDECILKYTKYNPTISVGNKNLTRDNYLEFFELIENPLLLKIAIEALPNILKNHEASEKRLKDKHDRIMYLPKFTRADIYRAFIETWHERAARRLLAITGQTEVKLWDYPNKFLTQEAFGVFCENLALSMFTANKNSEHLLSEVDYILPTLVTNRRRIVQDQNNDWLKFFSTEDEVIIAIRQGCPFRYMKNKYSFYHRSFLEYYIALSLFNELCDNESIEESTDRILSRLKDHPINKKLIVKNSAVIEFLAEMINGDAKRVERLLTVIRASRESQLGDSVATASANAMTILNKCFFNFSELSFEETNISNADLRGAFCDRTDFRRAKLNAVQFNNSWLNKADLSDSEMMEAQFGAWSLKFPAKIESYDISENFNRFAAVCEGKVYLDDNLNESAFKNVEKASFIRVVKFNSIGDRLAVINIIDGYDIKIDVFYSDSKNLIASFSCKNPGDILVFSIDSSILANVSLDNKIQLFDLELNKSVFLEGHSKDIMSLSFNKNNTLLASCCMDKIIKIWDLTDLCAKPKILAGHSDRVTSLTFHPNKNLMVSASWDSTVILWDLRSMTPMKTFLPDQSIYYHPDYLNVCFDQTGSMVAANADGGIVTIWDVSTGQIIQTQIRALKNKIHFHNTFITSDISGKYIRLFEVDSSNNRAYQLLIAFFYHISLNKRKILKFDPTGSIIEFNKNFTTMKEIRLKHISDKNKLTAIGFSHDGDFIFFHNKNESCIIRNNASTGEIAGMIQLQQEINMGFIRSCFSNNGKFIACGLESGDCILVDLNTNAFTNLQDSKKDQVKAVSMMTYSRDDSFLIIGYSSGDVEIFDIAAKKSLAQTKIHKEDINSILVSEDNKYFLSSCRNIIAIWELKSGRCFKKIQLKKSNYAVASCWLGNDTILYVQDFSVLLCCNIHDNLTAAVVKIQGLISGIHSIDDQKFFTTSIHSVDDEFEIIHVWSKCSNNDGFTLNWCSHYPNPVLNLSEIKYNNVSGLESKTKTLLKRQGLFEQEESLDGTDSMSTTTSYMHNQGFFSSSENDDDFTVSQTIGNN